MTAVLLSMPLSTIAPCGPAAALFILDKIDCWAAHSWRRMRSNSSAVSSKALRQGCTKLQAGDAVIRPGYLQLATHALTRSTCAHTASSSRRGSRSGAGAVPQAVARPAATAGRKGWGAESSPTSAAGSGV